MAGEGEIRKTTDAGTTWNLCYSGEGQIFYDVFFPDPDTGFASLGGAFILTTTDGGTTWSTQYTGTSNGIYSLFFTDLNTGYAVGDFGTILKIGGFPVVVNEITDYGLRITNYPNPVNQIINFSYTLKESGSVRIQVFNNFGQLVAEPLNSNQPMGERQVTWNAGNLPAGLYFYKIQTSKEIGAGKIIKL
jgi:hypothetical protein